MDKIGGDVMALFDDLKPEVVTAQVTTTYGKTVNVPLLMLSWERWEQIGRDVLDPPVPLTKAAPSGKPEDMLPNPQDKVYLERRAQAEDERTARRLLAALEGGGMVVPGDTLTAKVAAIKGMDAGLLQALVGVLAKAFYGVNARLQASADSFRTSAIDAVETANMPAMGNHAEGI